MLLITIRDSLEITTMPTHTPSTTLSPVHGPMPLTVNTPRAALLQRRQTSYITTLHNYIHCQTLRACHGSLAGRHSVNLTSDLSLRVTRRYTPSSIRHHSHRRHFTPLTKHGLRGLINSTLQRPSTGNLLTSPHHQRPAQPPRLFRPSIDNTSPQA